MQALSRRLSAAVLALFAGGSANAFDLPAVNLGFTSFLDGGPPAGPGWYFQEYLHFYQGDKLVDNDGNGVLAPTPRGLQEHNADAFVAMQQLIYQSNTPLLMGGKWGLNFMLPIVKLDASPDDSLAIQSNDTGLGDLLVGPYLQWDPVMGPNGPRFMHRIELQMVFPTGKYDANHELNPGSNHFSFNPYWAGTLFVTPRLTASWRLHYLWNAENDDPSHRTRFAIQLARPDLPVNDIRPGQAVHLNFAAAYEVVPKTLRLGINGYYLNQLTDTEVDGEDLSGRKEEVFAIGPGMVWHMSPETHVFANLYFETDAKNRPEGTRFNLRLVQHF
jgi:hypothetical protein